MLGAVRREGLATPIGPAISELKACVRGPAVQLVEGGVADTEWEQLDGLALSKEHPIGRDALRVVGIDDRSVQDDEIGLDPAGNDSLPAIEAARIGDERFHDEGAAGIEVACDGLEA